MGEAPLERHSTLFKDTQLLITQSHVVQCQQEDEAIVLVFICLYLVQHRLRFLQENESLLE